MFSFRPTDMDRTSEFKETLSQNKKSLKELDTMLPSDNGKQSALGKSKVFPGKKSEHFSKAKEISGNITKLKDFLKDCKNAYVNVGASKHAASNSAVFQASPFGNSSLADVSLMSDKERDQIDNDVQLIIQNCQKALHDFQIYIETSTLIQSQPQLLTHLENVVNSLLSYLKRVTQNYSEMRAIRVKRTIDYQSMSKLTTHPTSSRGLKSSISSLRNSTMEKPGPSSSSSVSSSSSSRKKFSEWDGPVPRPSSISSETDGLSTMSGSNMSEADTPVPTYFQDEDDAMSPEELQMLEQENAALLNELNTISQEVEQIESNVVQIAQLQEIFTEKVLQQEKDIDRIGNLIVHTTENIKGGNEQVRQAIQNSADFRAWVLFFIMVMSFSLLFLDWYNE